MNLVVGFLHEVGGLFLFTREVKRVWFKSFGRNSLLILEQIYSVGLRSLPTVALAGFFVGAILVIQFHMMLVQYDALSILGGINTSGCVREVGPLLISFLLAGKV